MSIGNFPESLSQAILVGIFLVGRLGVVASSNFLAKDKQKQMCWPERVEQLQILRWNLLLQI